MSKYELKMRKRKTLIELKIMHLTHYAHWVESVKFWFQQACKGQNTNSEVDIDLQLRTSIKECIRTARVVITGKFGTKLKEV